MIGRALVVDDDRHILEVVTFRLQSLGLEVMATGDPSKALQALWKERFDLALFDLRMTPMDGIELMVEALDIIPTLPVLIMTAHGTIENAVQAMQRGAFDYIVKPFRGDELTTRVQRALADRRLARSLERLQAIGRLLSSTGRLETILEAIVQTTLEATEAEGCTILLAGEKGEGLRAMASHGATPLPSERLHAPAAQAMAKKESVSQEREAGVTLAAPLMVEQEAVGALVVELSRRYPPSQEERELLQVFASHAAVAVRNAQELSRLRSGALAALGRMTAQVAHDLKNPLGGLKLYSLTLEKRLKARRDAQGQELAQKIAMAVDHLSDTVTEITTFARPREIQPSATKVHLLLDECLELVADRVEVKQIEVARHYDEDLPVALVDARELKRAFLNLIINGVEAMEERGSLGVTARWEKEAGEIEITIADTGKGMGAALRERIFEPFFTTKENGTGLGMAIAKSVIDLHGGRIEVESQIGRGTSVRVGLPVKERNG